MEAKTIATADNTSPTPHSQTSNSILETIDPVGRIRHSNTITHIARYFKYTYENTKLLDAADALQHCPEVPAVAVIDVKDQVTGILERDKLFSMIGKPFGREVLRRSLVSEHMYQAVSMDYRMDIFAAAETVQDQDTCKGDFYVLVDETCGFRGIFSRHDLNENLADIIKNDIILASKLQERLLSHSELKEKHYSAKAWTKSAKGVGGDFFYIQKTPEEKIIMAVCDVSGKGVSASFVVAMVMGMLRAADLRKGLKKLISGINTAVITAFHLEKYLTGLFLEYSPETKTLIYADMGHSHALVIRNNRCIHLKSQTLNLPVGLDIALTPALSGVRLVTGDRLFIYTDGITEQENQQGIEYGLARLEAALIASFASGQDPINELQASIEAFREGSPQQDDMTCLLFEVG